MLLQTIWYDITPDKIFRVFKRTTSSMIERENVGINLIDYNQKRPLEGAKRNNEKRSRCLSENHFYSQQVLHE